MANKSPVHVEPSESGWAVIRENSGRATSLHSTQSEAAEEGRELARREGTEFFLHAKDGQVREHRNYEKEPPPTPSENEEVVHKATKAAGAVAGGVAGAASRAVDAAGSAIPPARNDASQETERSGGGRDAEPDEAASHQSTKDAKEARGLTDAQQDDTSGTPEEQYAGYEAYDRDGQRLGKPDGLFVDEEDNPEYVGFRTDSSGSRSLLVPAEVLAFENSSRRMVVSRPKSVVEAGPSLEPGAELTSGLEERVRRHYGLAGLPGTQNRGGYGTYYQGEERTATERAGTVIPGVDTPLSTAGQTGGGEHDAFDRPERGVAEDEEELRVRRFEEELRVGTREHEAGAVRVRKRVRTERERIEVPKKRVEVTVERVPVEEESVASTGEEAASPEITEDEIVVPVIEEEVVVEKRPVVREEIRIRKEVVEETEVVEEDVRREEVEVDDQTERNDR